MTIPGREFVDKQDCISRLRESNRELHRQLSDLIVERNTHRMNARIWFCCFCVVSALWVLREVARWNYR